MSNTANAPSFTTRRARTDASEEPHFQLPDPCTMMGKLIEMSNDQHLLVGFYPYLVQQAETWHTATSVLALIEEAVGRFGFGDERFTQPARRYSRQIIRILVTDDSLYHAVLMRWSEWNRAREV